MAFKAKYPGVHSELVPHYLLGFAYIITGKVGQVCTHAPAYKKNPKLHLKQSCG